MISRRKFIGASALTGASVALAGSWPLSALAAPTAPELYTLADQLIHQWGYKLLSMQITDISRTEDYGGIWCPADEAVHGRSADAIYAFYYLASKTKDKRFIEAANILYQWTERRVSQPDGSWFNEPQPKSWQGTTVFLSTALGEALLHFGHLMPADFKTTLKARLKKAGDYVCKNFTISYGNINYPISGSYCLALLGELLNDANFKTRGRELAHEALKYFTPTDYLLYGEGDLQPTPGGCYSVDLGYNVEESLPALTMYGLLTKDEEVLKAVTHSMQSHLELMLPDGGWDNSWGTRNYKWTYWGSRTSDGCQTAYALLTHRDPRFYKAALMNTRLMAATTVDGLLQGGPQFAANYTPVCVHHTFTHIKALLNVMLYGDQKLNIDPSTKLPREENYGVRYLRDVKTHLIAKGTFKATVTAYDKDYKHSKNGHASGGALTMLWHAKTGPILCGSMNEYQIIEAGNQQIQIDAFDDPLTPRAEIWLGGNCYTNISDQTATVKTESRVDSIIVTTNSKLVDKDQQNPASGAINCIATYTFKNESVSLKFEIDTVPEQGKPQIAIPLIALSTETVDYAAGDRQLQLNRKGGKVILKANAKFKRTDHRGFNFVPGFQTLPIVFEATNCAVELSVV